MWPDPGVMAVLVETDHAVPASPSRGLGGSLEAGGEGRGEDRERNNPQHRGLEPALAGEAEAMGTGTGPFSSLSTPATMFGHQTTEAEKPPGRWCTKPSREGCYCLVPAQPTLPSASVQLPPNGLRTRTSFSGQRG